MDKGRTGIDPALRVHHFLPASYANGPGRRAVVWVQGCTLGCPGCFNPQTHAPSGGEGIAVDDLFARVAALEGTVEGITLSGGEPLQQREPLLALLQRLRRETALSVVLFTGYAWDEIQRMPEASALLACVDVVVAGRYVASQPVADSLRSSANQTLHLLTSRYTLQDVSRVPPAEVLITPEGEVLLSGTAPLAWSS